jgi:hypothetical protein
VTRPKGIGRTLRRGQIDLIVAGFDAVARVDQERGVERGPVGRVRYFRRTHHGRKLFRTAHTRKTFLPQGISSVVRKKLDSRDEGIDALADGFFSCGRYHSKPKHGFFQRSPAFSGNHYILQAVFLGLRNLHDIADFAKFHG